MKSSFKKLFLTVFLLASYHTFSQNPDGIKLFETQDGKKIKLLSDDKILFEWYEKITYADSTNIIGTTAEGKPICGMRIAGVDHQSYGTYKIVDSTLIMDFQDENPIEDLKIIAQNKKEEKEKTRIRIIKALDTGYDLEVYQNDKKICHIMWLMDECEFIMENVEQPLVFHYNGYKKSMMLNSETDTTIEVKINDLKGINSIKNERLTYELNQLVRKNKR